MYTTKLLYLKSAKKNFFNILKILRLVGKTDSGTANNTYLNNFEILNFEIKNLISTLKKGVILS